MTNNSRAIELADKILNENFVTEAPVRIEEIAKKYSYDITQSDMSKYRHFMAAINPEKDFILVDQTDDEATKAFAIAQALGIGLLAKEYQTDETIFTIPRKPLGSNVLQDVLDYPIELLDEAREFAVNLLVPKKILEKYKDQDSNSLAKIFGVPIEVIGYRAKYE